MAECHEKPNPDCSTAYFTPLLSFWASLLSHPSFPPIPLPSSPLPSSSTFDLQIILESWERHRIPHRMKHFLYLSTIPTLRPHPHPLYNKLLTPFLFVWILLFFDMRSPVSQAGFKLTREPQRALIWSPCLCEYCLCNTGIKPRASHRLSKDSTNWATSPAHLSLYSLFFPFIKKKRWYSLK